MKGQLTILNILYIFIGLYLYMIALYPILVGAINDIVIAENASPHVWSAPMTTILQIIPIAFPIGMLATIFLYATPRQVSA